MSVLSLEDRSILGQGNSKGQGNGVATFITCDSGIVLPDETWIVDSCCMRTFSLAGGYTPNPSTSGLFLCPPGTQPFAGSRFIDSMIQLPVDSAGFAWDNAAVPRMDSFTTVSVFIVPPGWFIRAILDATPVVPAIADFMELLFTYARRKICPPC